MITYHISTTGNDQATGTTPQTPFATLTHTQHMVRQHAGKEPVTVYLHKGTYCLNQSLAFTSLDSATESAPILYCAYQHQQVILTNTHSTTPLLSLTDVHHTTFQNLTIENTPHDGIHITKGSHVQITNCTLHNIAHIALIIEGGTHHTIQNCTIHHTGNTSIQIHGGNRHTLIPANHTLTNCHIHHSAQKNPTQPSIQVTGVGTSITHNHIHHCPHSALSLSGNEHHITYNHIHHTSLQSPEMGTLYMAQDWTERGIKIEFNFFHDLIGILLDDCASGALIRGNIFARCIRAIFIGGGRNHRIDNNVFIHCNPALQIDGRGLDPSPQWHTLLYTTMKSRFESISPLTPPYSTHYPELREVAMYYQGENGIPPEGNLILRNIFHQSTDHLIHWHATPKMIALQNNLRHEDPHFTDPQNDNYQLAPNSPAIEIGIKPIPQEKIGPSPT